MHRCTIVTVATYPHIHTHSPTYTYTHAESAMFAALDSSSTHPIYNTILYRTFIPLLRI
jgi:hypothetical protein